MPNSDEELEKKIEEKTKKKLEEDDDEKFIKKDSTESLIEEAEKEIKGVISTLTNLKNLIKPAANQQRNLDREVGGMEESQEKEASGKDAWDDRSEEVDAMGSTDTFNTTGMKSVVWKQKKDRIAKKKADIDHEASAGAAIEMQRKSKDAAGFEKMGYVDRLKNLKQDHSHQTGSGGRGI